jgi:flagellar motor switch/type III secretory pathway protein FliN
MPSAYPWGALEPVTRAASQVATRARQAFGASAARAADALSELLELPCQLLVKRLSLGRAPALGQTLWLSHDQVAIGILAEPALSTFIAAHVLRRAPPLTDPSAALASPLAGLFGALAVETARRIGVPTALLGAAPVGEEALVADVTALLEGRPFTLKLFVVGAAAPRHEPELERLGALPLRLALVVATVAMDRQELLTLEREGALVLGDGASIDARGTGHGILVSPHSERGIRVDLRADGRLVIGETCEAKLTVEPEKDPNNDGETLTDVLLDTPLVVRVELGSVSMSARDWARLGPGDIIETAQRIAEPVILRVAGREVGRGELINVDGQVGVRIQKLFEAT